MSEDPDKLRGFYSKWEVIRRITQSSNGKHDNCDLFVLDLKHDKFARGALAIYAEACAEEYPILSKDLGKLLLRNMP